MSLRSRRSSRQVVDLIQSKIQQLSPQNQRRVAHAGRVLLNASVNDAIADVEQVKLDARDTQRTLLKAVKVLEQTDTVREDDPETMQAISALDHQQQLYVEMQKVLLKQLNSPNITWAEQRDIQQQLVSTIQQNKSYAARLLDFLVSPTFLMGLAATLAMTLLISKTALFTEAAGIAMEKSTATMTQIGYLAKTATILAVVGACAIPGAGWLACGSSIALGSLNLVLNR